MKIKTEDRASYSTGPAAAAQSAEDEQIVKQALRILEKQIKTGDILTSPEAVQSFLRLKYGAMPFEIFGVIWLTTLHRVIVIEEMFRGTIDGASVHPHEVVRSAIKENASACILFHNHPSGSLQFSQADQRITRRLQEVLNLIEVKVLDHILVSTDGYASMAQQGLL